MHGFPRKSQLIAEENRYVSGVNKRQSSMINKDNATKIFLDRVEQLYRLPLITDSEMNELFGGEVAAALAELNRYNGEEEVCSHCEKRCCQVTGCELYAPQFSQCPIHDLRPVVCRLHFCHKFHISDNSLIKELGDIFFDSLLAADRYGSSRVRLFDSPPLGGSAPGLVAATSPWLNEVREGSLDAEYAERLIRREAEKYRIADVCSEAAVEVRR